MEDRGSLLMQDKSSVTATQGATVGQPPKAIVGAAVRMRAVASNASAPDAPHAQADRSFATMFSQAMVSETVQAQNLAQAQQPTQMIVDIETPSRNGIEPDTQAGLPNGSVATNIFAEPSNAGGPATKLSRPPLPMPATRGQASPTERKMSRTGVRDEPEVGSKVGIVPFTDVQPTYSLEPSPPTAALHLAHLPAPGPQAQVVGDVGRRPPLGPAAPDAELRNSSGGETIPAPSLQSHLTEDTAGLKTASPQPGEPTPASSASATSTGAPIISLTEAKSEPQPSGSTASHQTQVSASTRVSVPDQIAPALLRLSSADGVRHISLQLAPRDLGAVLIEIEQPASGPAVVTLTVQHADTLALLHRDIEQLTKALDRAGIDSANKMIALHLAPNPLTMPANDPGSQQSYIATPSNEVPSNSWQGSSSPGHGSQQSSSENHQRQETQVAGRFWSEAVSEDEEPAAARPGGKQQLYGAGLNITA